MLVRPEAFTTLPGDPLSILADANWQMIAMLNILLSICLCCIMYHTEFADRGIQKSETLPVKAQDVYKRQPFHSAQRRFAGNFPT